MQLYDQYELYKINSTWNAFTSYKVIAVNFFRDYWTENFIYMNFVSKAFICILLYSAIVSSQLFMPIY